MIMLIGLPCSGKSTFVQENYPPDFPVASTDSYIEEIARERGQTYSECFPHHIGMATKTMNENVQRYVRDGISFIWDQTNLTVSSRRKKLAAIPSSWSRRAVFYDVPFDVLLKRNANRIGKRIPLDVMEKMRDSYERPSLDEGFDRIVDIAKLPWNT